MLSVTILGNNSAVPAFDRHPTSQVVTLDGNNYLVDCGEGTQIQMIKYKIRRGKISHIFISHLHGDHYFGLVGLINSFGLLSHQQDLHVFGPSPLQEIVELQLKVAKTVLPFNLYFHTINKEGLLVEDSKIEVRCFKTNHRIECYGFSFREKKQPRKIDVEKVKAAEIPASFYKKLEEGMDYTTKNNVLIKNDTVTIEAPKGKSYVFCADTKYDESLLPHLYDADMIYHETTYLDNLKEKAIERFHSTSSQAAMIAKKGRVKKLLIGHFSSKYAELDEFEKEARVVFENTEIALEGVAYAV
ncbi:MAG TPA: ribonuclease Z [Chitinophagaceae bacterium]